MSWCKREMDTAHMGSLLSSTQGSPEQICSLCSRHTIPDDFAPRLAEYAHQGLRVLALAYRRLDADISMAEVRF